jgi:hypothetical protein
MSSISLFIQEDCRENNETKPWAKPGADGGGLCTRDFTIYLKEMCISLQV